MREFGYEDSIGFGVNRMTNILAYTFGQQLCNKVMFTLDQGKIMVLCNNNNNNDDKADLTKKEITEKLELKDLVLISTIYKLEKDELIIKKSDKKDKRHNRFFLTEKSFCILKSMIDCSKRKKQILLKDIFENISITKNTLKKIWCHIQKEFTLNFIIVIKDIDNGSNVFETNFDKVNENGVILGNVANI